MKIPQATYGIIYNALTLYLSEAENHGNSDLAHKIEVAYDVLASIG